MKNVVIIDFDSDRDRAIEFKKVESTPPENRADAEAMIKLDIDLMVEALYELMSVAEQGGYQDKETNINLIKKRFKV